MKNIRKLILSLFFVSGISGLMYEVVWVRMYSRIIGSTNYAISIVLAAFMGGLALGSILFGRISDRKKNKLDLFAYLELSVGLIACVVTLVLPLFGPFYKNIYLLSHGATGLAFFIRVSLLFLCILIPATFMGGTLPVLISYLSEKYKTFGKDLSLLYGINTLGAVFGVLISGYITLGALGERKTVFIGIVLNLAVAAAALVLSAVEKKKARKQASEFDISAEPLTEPLSSYSSSIRMTILASLFFSGMTALAYEVIWSRQLILYLKTSIYAFSAMLATFLTGIALGSIFVTRLVKKIRHPLFCFGIVEILIGTLSIISIYTFNFIDGLRILRLFGGIPAAVVIVMPLTFLFGAAFPIASLAYTKNTGKAGSSVGALYSSNTLGNIIGSLLGGFFLIPFIGSSRAIIVLGLANMLIGIMLVLLDKHKEQKIKIKVMLFLPIALLLALGLKGTDPFLDLIADRISRSAEIQKKSYKIFFNKEGVQGTTTSFEIGKNKFLWINGIGMTCLCTDTKIMAHLPVMLSPDPKEMLIIAFGMGTTPRSATLYQDLNVTTVEILPEVYECFRFYHPDAEQVLKRKNLHTIVGDGRNYLFLSDKKYDIISMDPAPPIWSQGTVNLYSREFFALCKQHLTPQGMMCLWFPGDATEDEVKAVLHSFYDVFPHTQVWTGIRGWGFYFVGMPEGLEINRSRFKKLFQRPEIYKDLTEYAHYDRTCQSAEQLLGLFMWDEKEVADIIKGFPIVTDDFPYTEFPIWRHDLYRYETWKPKKQIQYENSL